MQLFCICVCLLLHYFCPEGGTPEDRGVRETDSGKSLCLQLCVKLFLLLFCLTLFLFYYKTELDQILYNMQLCHRRKHQKLSQVSCFVVVE